MGRCTPKRRDEGDDASEQHVAPGYTIEFLVARLMAEPFFLSPEDVGKLTFRQINSVILCDRDEHGVPVFHPQSPNVGNREWEGSESNGGLSGLHSSYKALFYSTWKKRGHSEEWINERWKLKAEELELAKVPPDERKTLAQRQRSSARPNRRTP